MQINRKTWRRMLTTSVCILLGNAILAFLVAAFIIPHDIIMGGTTGIGIVLHKIFPNLDTALVVLILNLILLFLGFAFLGKKLFLTTVASSILYPVLLGAFQRIPGIDSLTDDSTMAAIFAGLLMGLSLGLVIRVGSSTGGTDIVCLLLHHWFHLPISALVYITDAVILFGQAFFTGTDKILLGILVLILETILLEQVTIIGKSQVQLFVVSDRYEEIREELLTGLEAGVTMTMIETGRLEKRQQGVLCVIPPRKLYNATELIHGIDPEAFVTVTKIKEVRGRGFTQERAYVQAMEAKRIAREQKKARQLPDNDK